MLSSKVVPAALLCIIRVSSFEIEDVSSSVVLKQGEDAEIFCNTDQAFDSCVWYTPTGKRCQMSVDSRMCRAYDNIHFNGSDFECRIVVKDVKLEQSGLWTCSVAKEGEEVNETVSVTEALRATVEWDDDLFGTLYLTAGQPETVTCKAVMARPKGEIIYHLEEDIDTSKLISTHEEELSTDANGVSNSSLSLSLDPKPEYNDKRLHCTYLQEDGQGRMLYKQTVSLELRVHFLEKSNDNQLLSPAESGEDYQISLKFTALPPPDAEDIHWKIVDKEGQEKRIKLHEENMVVEENYIVYPLVQVSQYEYEAKMVILNISKRENENDHFLTVSNRLLSNADPMTIEQHFDVQVDVSQIVVEESFSMTTTIVIIVLLVIASAIVAAMTVVWAKNKSRLCFASSTRPYISPDITAQKEPMVKHHPYGRPSEA